ncbi:MAG: ABC transporter ATP-binding protein [Actinomycetota bacterium]
MPTSPLRTWLRRSAPTSDVSLRALGAATAAQIAGTILSIGAPLVLIVSAAHQRDSHPFSAVAGLLILIELVAFLRAPLRFSERLSGHDIGFAAIVHWRSWLTATIGRWSYDRWSRASRGDLLERALGDVDSLQDLWLRAIIPFVATVLTSLLSLILLCVVAARDASTPLVALAIVLLETAVVARLFLAARGSLPLARRSNLARVARSVRRLEVTAAASEFSLLGRSDVAHAFLRAAGDRDEALRCASDRRTRHRTLLLLLATAGILGLGLHLATHWSSSPGASVSYSGVVLLVALLAVDLFATTARSLDIAVRLTLTTERLDELAERDEDSPGVSAWPAGPVTLSFDDVVVPPGQRIALVGPSGSGKSTLLRQLANLEAARDFSVMINDHDLRDIAESEIRQHVGFVAAIPQYLRGAAVDVLGLGRGPRIDVTKVAEELGIPLPVSTRWLLRSRGEDQRAALLRALWTAPEILLLDEPTSGLGTHETPQLLQVLEETAATCIIATHDPSVVSWCDVVYDLASGQIISR